MAQKGRGTVKGEELHGAGVGMLPWRQRGFSRKDQMWLVGSYSPYIGHSERHCMAF